MQAQIKLPSESSPRSERHPLENNPTTTSLPRFTVAVTFVVASLLYGFFFVKSLSRRWFNPKVTTDDALQQSYMFHEIYNPGIFTGDLITESMLSYLGPVHYWVTYAATYLTADPIMAGHWIMLLQVVITCTAIFFAVQKAAATAPACFAVAWFLHSRHLVQRLTGGLPRGWAAPVLCATICFAIYGKHYAVLLTLLVGCLTNPPSTIIAALFYGLVLCWRSFFVSDSTLSLAEQGKLRRQTRKHLIQYILLSPCYAGLTYVVTRPPDFFGKMVSYTEALTKPELSMHGGRFALVPFVPAWEEIKAFGFQAFVSAFNDTPEYVFSLMPWVVIALGASFALVAIVQRRVLAPAELMLYLLATLSVYFLSRPLAFHLYIPDRHLKLPLGFFFIVALPVILWRLSLSQRGDAEVKGPTKWIDAGKVLLCFALLSGLIFLGSGTGLRGDANFNVAANRKGQLFEWLKANTPQNSLIAGHPSHVDDTMLFAMRKAYITAETAHPFYEGYYQEAERRLRIVWKAYLATDVQELHQLLEKEGIDYFIYRRNDFRRHMLPQLYYYEPLTSWVRELASRTPEEYAFSKLPWGAAGAANPVMPFRDAQSVVLDVAQLGQHLRERDARK